MVQDPAARAPDARRSLRVLRDEWAACERCDLGARRMTHGTNFVFGERVPPVTFEGGILLVGDGPSDIDELEGRPFADKPGRMLRAILAKLGAEQYYLTNTVSCRSCENILDADQQPLMRRNYETKQMEPVYRDRTPTPLQVKTCLPRLREEIYLVDPTVVVGLGPKAHEALIRNGFENTNRGSASIISIPGASFVPGVTKDKKWIRRLKGQTIQPTEQSAVEYYYVPTLSHGTVYRNIQDHKPKSDFNVFVDDLRKAVEVFEKHCEITFGEKPARSLTNAVADIEEIRRQFEFEE